MRKKILFVTFVVALAACLDAQKLPDSGGEFYKQRENKAPKEIKERLKALRVNIAAHHYGYTVGYTTALEKDSPGCGISPTLSSQAIERQHSIAQRALQSTHPARAGSCSPASPSYDLSIDSAVPPVATQQCSDCWAFATKDAIESNIMVQRGGTPGVSVEDIVACTQGVSCSQQAAPTAFDQAKQGIAGDNEVPYRPVPASQSCSGKKTYQVLTYDFVSSAPLPTLPTPDQIKQAVCDHGAVAAGVYASNAFKSYTGGVFQEAPPTNAPWMNHWVTIIGWDDNKNAWRVKSSWGTGWGESGYAWVDYSSADIGFAAQWVVSM